MRVQAADRTARTRLLARALKYRYRQDTEEIRFVRLLTPAGDVEGHERGGVRGTHPVAEFDSARCQRDDRKLYVNNFIFTKTSGSSA